MKVIEIHHVTNRTLRNHHPAFHLDQILQKFNCFMRLQTENLTHGYIVGSDQILWL